MEDDAALRKLHQNALDRQPVIVDGVKLYDWKQTIDEVHLFLNPPFGCTVREMDIKIEASKLSVGTKRGTALFKGDLFSIIDTNDSFWMIEDNELHIQMGKMRKGEVWNCAVKGHPELDPVTQQEIQKDIMLQRFQEENPGFDFSSATFSGSAPNPREFMGGISYNHQ
ncbi:nuclear movement protein domain containing protein [Cardiosporidium cionae]|uniref:Nuclear movement protein domain containing protein n=1 Tax=Cardiosporidium cionae TaxID=476202 RepID=A0ABQ7JDV7_9APIC|nr:nuclear movement protein domain containing protein [Cardiosporidium cionae]|eukprot:KAF8822202.1 nuclear movement protein domain containing protein [Cardiosporidium cionae]